MSFLVEIYGGTSERRKGGECPLSINNVRGSLGSLLTCGRHVAFDVARQMKISHLSKLSLLGRVTNADGIVP